MEKMLFTFALALLFTAAVGQPPCTGSFVSPSGDWIANWTVSDDYLYATFSVMAQTDGWVAIGFSRNHIMPMTDVIVGAASADGRQYFVSDRYATSQTAPNVDRNQNITNLGAEQVTRNSQIYTIITFTRPICSNNADDVGLSEDTYLLWASGPVRNYDGNDPNSIGGHMRPDRGAAGTIIDFTCGATRGTYYSNDTGINWHVSWRVSPDASSTTFHVMAETTGWVAIGFSLNRMMANTDIIVGASDGANYSYVSDRYAPGRVPPLVDAYQDISDTMATQMEENGINITRFYFTRPTVSTDDNDVSLGNADGVYYLHAWGMEANFNASDPMSIMQHSNTSRTASQERFFFLSSCGVIIVEPNVAPVTTPPPTTDDGAAVTVTTTLPLILLLIALMNILI